MNRIFVCNWTFIGWRDISFGVHICLGEWYVDLHIPFGWIRVGLEREPETLTLNWRQCQANTWGLVRERNLIRREFDPNL